MKYIVAQNKTYFSIMLLSAWLEPIIIIPLINMSLFNVQLISIFVMFFSEYSTKEKISILMEIIAVTIYSIILCVITLYLRIYLFRWE
jgi:hypothetical protein